MGPGDGGHRLDAHTVRFDLGEPGRRLPRRRRPCRSCRRTCSRTRPGRGPGRRPVRAISRSATARSPLVELTDEPRRPRAGAAARSATRRGAARRAGPPARRRSGRRASRAWSCASTTRRRRSPPPSRPARSDSAADLPPADAIALAASTAGRTGAALPDARRSPRSRSTCARSEPASRTRAPAGRSSRRSTARPSSPTCSAGPARGADTPIPPSSWAYDPKAAPLVAFDRGGGRQGPPGRRLEADRREGVDRARRGRSRSSCRSWPRTASANPIVHAIADRVATAWTSLGLATTVEALPPGEFVERLRTGDFAAAVIDVNLGLDPDPYPILASTQAREGGSNVTGIQDATLDAALAGGPRARDDGGAHEGLRRAAAAPRDAPADAGPRSSATASSSPARSSSGPERPRPSPIRATGSGTWYDGTRRTVTLAARAGWSPPRWRNW